MATLITGVAGFIGFHTARRLLERGEAVLGIDDLNDYYDVRLKEARLDRLRNAARGLFRFSRTDFADHLALETALAGESITRIIHLGAQAGVRYSIENPRAYVEANLMGHLNVLEIARAHAVEHMIYASSSAVYGGNTAMPFTVEDRVDHPVSLYAATKKADELMSETYAHIHAVPLTGLRFFTVYGPWGRPDMAMWLFTDAILNDRPIDVYNYGVMRRDFTEIDDVVGGLLACLDNPPRADGVVKPGGSHAPHRIYNIGAGRTEALDRMIDLVEDSCGRKADRRLLPMQPGDIAATYADISAIQEDLGFSPSVSIEVGVPRFVGWFRDYHGI